MDSTIAYLGTLLQGGIVVFLVLAAAFFFVMVPIFKPRMNKAARALIYSEGWVCLFIAFTYMAWMITKVVLMQNSQDVDGIYDVPEDTILYHILIYLDLMALPISMQIGYAITTGKAVTFKQFLMFAAIYVVCGGIDYSTEIPYVFQAVHFLTILICAAQLAWFWKFIKTYDKRLLDVCSNIDGRSMKWYLWIQVPQFLLAVLYIPLCLIIEGAWADVLYDFFVLLITIFVVAGIFLYRVDDMTTELIAENFKEITGKDIEPQAVKDEQKVQEVQEVQEVPVTQESPEMPESPEIQETAQQPVAEQPATASEPTEQPAAEQPAEPAAPQFDDDEVEDIKTYDFSAQMKKLEEERFYLNPDVNIDWLTRKLGTNRHYVSDYMSQILHMTFYEYVNSLRLHYAERLITSGREKVNQVAYSSGFNSDHTFRRLFKEHYGCTPTQYVKRAA